MKLSDFVASFIASQGVKHVFLLPGGGCMHLIDSVGKEPKLSYVACLHEQAAAIAADGYAQLSGNLGVALVTTGPGSTNAITGVAGSWIESVPLFVISGQVKTADIKPEPQMRMLGFQEVDIVSMVKSITKYAVTIKDPMTILYHLEKAAYLSTSGRPGPVWIDIPLDMQASDIDVKALKGYDKSEINEIEPDNVVLKTLVSETLIMLSTSKRPVIIAGNGIKLAKAQSIFMKIINELGIPVLTTWKGCDLISEDHPFFYGRPGSVGQRGANFIQQNSDFVLSLGSRLDFGQIGYAQETFAREAKKVIVDIDEVEFLKFRFNVDLKVAANVLDFLTELDFQVKEGFQKPAWKEWLSKCLDWKLKYPVVLPEHKGNKEFVSTYALVDVISNAAREEDLIVPCSSGSGADITSQTFRVKAGQRVINSPGIGAMGFGVPQSIGVCLAGNMKRTICINGDGGFQLNIQELETIKRLNLPIKFFYLNNQGYISIRTTQNNYFNGRYVATGRSSGLTLPDIRKISDAYGIPNNQIKFNSQLETGIAEALAGDGPFICEVMIDPDEQVMPKVKSILDSKGKMVSKPLEDLAPFLDRKEFLDNMIVKPLEE